MGDALKIDNLTRDTCMFAGLVSATFGTLILAADKLGWRPPSTPVLQLLFWSSLFATIVFGGFAIYGSIILIKREISKKPIRKLITQLDPQLLPSKS
jgi:hypothetical protein